MVDARVIDQQSEEQNHVGIAVNHGVEERAKHGYLVGAAGHPAIDHVEDAGPDDHQTCIEKHAAGIGGVGMSKQECGGDVDDQAEECEDVGGDASEGQAMNYSIKKPAAAAAKGTGPGHCG